MNSEIAAARDALRRMLAGDSRAARADKVHCLNPSHDDRHPSMQLYDDDRGGHAYCFTCGYRIDAVEYLVERRGASTREALELLGLAEGAPTPRPPRQAPPPPAPPAGCGSRRPLRALPDGLRKLHEERVALQELRRRIPPALSGRGFLEADIWTLQLAEDGDGDGLFAIFGPAGELLNIKRRLAHVKDGQRYVYEVAGNGSPAWCSPGILKAPEILVMEGELNAMISWCVRPELGVMGAAGSSGCLHLEPLAGRTVYVYADRDEAGAKARERWARQARDAGAARVLVVEPWPDGDACDVAGRLSREHLRDRLS